MPRAHSCAGSGRIKHYRSAHRRAPRTERTRADAGRSTLVDTYQASRHHSASPRRLRRAWPARREHALLRRRTGAGYARRADTTPGALPHARCRPILVLRSRAHRRAEQSREDKRRARLDASVLVGVLRERSAPTRTSSTVSTTGSPTNSSSRSRRSTTNQSGARSC